MLKIFKSVDVYNSGQMKSSVFKSTLIECFPVLAKKEITTLLRMARRLSEITQNEDGKEESHNDDDPMISYMGFLMHIEKYYALSGKKIEKKEEKEEEAGY